VAAAERQALAALLSSIAAVITAAFGRMGAVNFFLLLLLLWLTF